MVPNEICANSKENGHLHIPGKIMAVIIVDLVLWMPMVSDSGPEKGWCQ